MWCASRVAELPECWLCDGAGVAGRQVGSRRVIINRRGEVVEDVEAIRAPQAGRDLALAIDTRLQYLAFRELKAAELVRAMKGRMVIDPYRVLDGSAFTTAGFTYLTLGTAKKISKIKYSV